MTTADRRIDDDPALVEADASDAGADPGGYRCLFKVAVRAQVRVTFVANQWIRTPTSPLLQSKQVHPEQLRRRR